MKTAAFCVSCALAGAQLSAQTVRQVAQQFPAPPNTTVVDKWMEFANLAFDSDSAWRETDVVFATGTNAANVQGRAIRATALR
jgi:hypothetical protein